MILSVPSFWGVSKSRPNMAARWAYSSGSSSKMATIPGSPWRRPSAMNCDAEHRLARSGRPGHQQAVALGDAAAHQRVEFGDAGGKTPPALDVV